ncbi:hypothetical protein P4B35_05740 [Pontiellaceae bacterium B12227]|nr:hypothetical protein [Pontiellaceae bacterium B12227]
MKMNVSGLGIYLLLISAFLLSGCVSKQLEPEDNPKLGVAQSSNNMVAFALETKPGYKYSILYQDQKDMSWKPIKGCESIIGTGETIEIEKKFNSRGPLPPFTVNYSKL